MVGWMKAPAGDCPLSTLALEKPHVCGVCQAGPFLYAKVAALRRIHVCTKSRPGGSAFFPGAQAPNNRRPGSDALAVDRVAQLMRKTAQKEGQCEPEFFHDVPL